VNEGKYVLVLSDAEKDIDEVYSWYEQRQTGLGNEFMDCLSKCFESIKLTPNAHTLVYKSYRRALVKRFPYAVLYEYVDEAIFVYSVFHCSQDVARWQSRLP
jgi:plasmid stabilization system protein ParE